MGLGQLGSDLGYLTLELVSAHLNRDVIVSLTVPSCLSKLSYPIISKHPDGSPICISGK